VRDGAVRVKAVYLALGINLAGEKEILGLWIAQSEGAKFWLPANILEFKLPDARAPGNGDERILALALRSLSLY
jgi:hypothetical protein